MTAVPVASFSILFLFNVIPWTLSAEVGPKCGSDKDSFINICGYCVEGSTGLNITEGLDKCKTCFGFNKCIKCDSTQDPDCESNSFPHKFDLALKKEKYKLYLQSSSFKGNTDGIVCSLKLSSQSPDTNDDTTDGDQISSPLINREIIPYILIDIPLLKKGSYITSCSYNTSNSISLKSTFQVVDSRDLRITSVQPPSVTSNVPFKASINYTDPQNTHQMIVCFTRVNGIAESVTSARKIADGFVECGPMTVYHNTAVFIGISKSLETALDNSADVNLKELLVHPSAPLVKRSTFSSDLRLIFIQFDKNISPSSRCRKAFSPETISLFGKGWDCWIRADQLVVQLGSNPVIHPGSRISLSPSNDIQQINPSSKYVSILQGSTTIVDDVTNQVVEPVYNILAPKVACYGTRHIGLHSSIYAQRGQRADVKEAMMDGNSVTVLEVQQLGGQNLFYNWSVSFSPSKNRHALSQRDILLTWLSVRMLDKSVRAVNSNKVALNNSLMLSNVDYTVTVRGTNALGMTGEEKRIPLRLEDKKPLLPEHRALDSEMARKACSSGSPLDVMLSSSPATFSDVEFCVEVSTSCCDGSLNPDILGQVGYAWSVKSYNGTELKVGFYQGKFFKIPPGTFHGGERYKISCDLYHKVLNKSLGSASTSVVTLERGIKIIVNVSGVEISTQQPLILDASASLDLDNKRGVLQFEWSCRMVSNGLGGFGYGDNQCYVPIQKKLLLHAAYASALKKPILNLPPGSLSIGRYHFSAKVSRPANSQKLFSNVMTVEVSVVGGSPPLVYIPSRTSASASDDISLAHVINPDDGVTLTGIVIGLKAGCHISWNSIDQPGYITLNQSLLHHEPYTAVVDSEKPHEISAELSPGLIGDAKYRFRLSCLCSHQEGLIESSYADIDIFTDAPPVVKPLTVEPSEGEALVTEFRFSTQPAYDDLLDYPLRYSFGFQILEEGSNTPGPAKFFHSSSQKLSATTYLPAISRTSTKIQSLLRVCDVRHICHTTNGPLVLSNAPKQLTSGHVELLSEGFSSFLMAEEYEDAIMLVESSMLTLEVLDDKSLYQLASKRVEKAVNSQLDLFEKRLDSSPTEVNAALRFLKAANAALKHGAFSQETLQRLVAFKDRILGMLGDETKPSAEYENNFRRRRQAQTEEEQPRSILQPEMVRTLLSVSEVAIFNLSDTSKALNEKRKLLQNVSFFMDSLCRGLRNSVPIFIGSRVVSFSVQRLNMQVKYKDDLAIPDWRSSKSGGTPVNATAQICLGEDVQQLLSGKMVCMGAAFYPMDLLSEVAQISMQGVHRHSSVYLVKIIQNTSQKVTVTENYEGFDAMKQTVRVKIPIWSKQMDSGMRYECRVWLHGTWDSRSCRFVKFATLINKPAVECLCSTVGYYAVFAVETPSITTTEQPASFKTPPSSTEVLTTPSTTTTTTTAKPTNLPTTSTQKTTVTVTTARATAAVSTDTSTTLPPGIPIPNTSKNFTFKIQEEFSATVGSNEVAFISQLKHDILKQVEMPANMIDSIDLAPGSILVTLHLVDTDIRTVDDVLPSLAAVLQDGRLSVNGFDGRQLTVPPQSLKLLQHRVEHSFVPWIIIGCTGFGLFSIGSLVIAAIIVKRQMRDMDFMDNSGSPEITNKTPAYGRFHLEQTLDGSEATLSRYRSSVTNPLVVSTIGGLASVMGTNAVVSSDHLNTTAQFRLQPPQSESSQSTRNVTNAGNTSGNTSGSSGNDSINSVHKKIRNGSSQKQIMLSDSNGSNIELKQEEDDSGIIMNGRAVNSISTASRSQTPEAIGQQLPDVQILPGTPTGRSTEEFTVTSD